MALSNQVFISFALKDVALRDTLEEQIGKINTKMKCVDMPMKKIMGKCLESRDHGNS